MYHASLILPYNYYLYVLCLEKKNNFSLIGQLSRLLAWHPARRAVKSTSPSLRFEMRQHLTGSPLKIRSTAQGSRVWCFFLLLAAHLSSDLAEEIYSAKEEIYSAKKEIRDKKQCRESSMRRSETLHLNPKPE